MNTMISTKIRLLILFILSLAWANAEASIVTYAYEPFQFAYRKSSTIYQYANYPGGLLTADVSATTFEIVELSVPGFSFNHLLPVGLALPGFDNHYTDHGKCSNLYNYCYRINAVTESDSLLLDLKFVWAGNRLEDGKFSLTAQVVPIPASGLLFFSALGLFLTKAKAVKRSSLL